MPWIVKKKEGSGDDLLGWIGVTLALIAAFVLDKGSAPHKWHAAIIWTFVASFGLLIFGREKRSSFWFWAFWAACFILHALAMWLLFGRLLPRLVLGTLYVIPIAMLEAILLTGIYSRLEHNFGVEQANPEAASGQN